MKSYRKKNVQPMRPYIVGEDLSGISVSPEDTPELGGMIAINPNNEKDQWYIAKAFFEENYDEVKLGAISYGLTFGQAIEAAKMGKKIARAGWNGKNMFVVYMSALSLPPFNTADTNRKVNDRTAKFIGEDKPLNSQPYFAMFNAQEEWIPGWLASQSDMLSDDWAIVD